MNKSIDKQVKATGVIVTVLLFYLLAYVLAGENGQYQCHAYGVRQGSDGKAYLVEKFARKWEPFPLHDKKADRPTLRFIVFMPLVLLDRKLVHNENPWGPRAP